MKQRRTTCKIYEEVVKVWMVYLDCRILSDLNTKLGLLAQLAVLADNPESGESLSVPVRPSAPNLSPDVLVKV